LIGFSIFYFTDVLIRASEKYFWFDELVTMYICRLTSLHAIWQVVAHGVDFNPPFFYILSRASKAVFGETLIGMRAPQIIGFWLLCVCLFRFVNRRRGPLAGLLAMVLPMTTGAFYYSYEARGHGIVLGFCGLALVCWQMALETPRKIRWLVGFSLCLLGAALTHCYALLLVIPFSIVELFRTVGSRRIDRQMWAALVVPSLIAFASYLPLLRSYRSQLGASSFSTIFPPSVGQISGFYNFLLAPCVVVMLCSAVLLAADRLIGVPATIQSPRSPHTTLELLLGVSFLGLPLFGLAVAVLVHTVFIDRYFISAVAGVSIVIASGLAARARTSWIAMTLAAVMACSLGWQFSALVWHRYHAKGESLQEPSSGLLLDTTPGHPIANHPLLVKASGGSLPIVVLQGLEFVYLSHYAPDLRSRLYYVGTSVDDFSARGLRNFSRWCPTEFNPIREDKEFVQSFPHFLVYGYGDPTVLEQFSELVRLAGGVKTVQVSKGHYLAEVGK
jgi:hypothetical protein